MAGALAARGLHFATAQEATPDPVADLPDLMIVAIEYAFEMPASAEGGWTHVTLDNQGMMEHHAMFLRVNDGSTVEDVQAALQSGDFGALFAVATSIGGPTADPGHQGSVVMDLLPGQYLVICAIPDEEGVPHFALGQIAALEVTEGSAGVTPPTADATVTMIEMAFEGLPTDATAGTHIWELTNPGAQLHELVVLQLSPGVTIDQAMQIFTAPPPATPVATPAVAVAGSPPADAQMQGPPFVGIGGVAPMSPGEINLAVLDLAAGDYIAICFVPDPATGAPHFALGMISGFTVS